MKKYHGICTIEDTLVPYVYFGTDIIEVEATNDTEAEWKVVQIMKRRYPGFLVSAIVQLAS